MSNIGKAISRLVGNLMPKMPTIDIPAMPDPGSASAKIAAQKKIQAKSKSGRDGTIYSGGGGGSYNQTNLGGTA